MRTDLERGKTILRAERLFGILAIFFIAGGLAARAGARPQHPEPQEAGLPAIPPSPNSAQIPAHSHDIISENLDRVAASASRILEVLNREAGLMVEFKRLLSQEAGANGQILEESDLTDGAVADRLGVDLRARVLATRLLQRYGYLVPRLNPDSGQRIEQKSVRPAALEERESAPADSMAPARNLRPPPLQRASDALPAELTFPDGKSVAPELPGGVPHHAGYATGGDLSSILHSPSDLTSLSALQPEPPAIGDHTLRTSRSFERYPVGSTATTGSVAVEPVRMLRRPNPYADVPSLYDLYVQAAGYSRPLERFGLDVFRKGQTNPEYLPMDLPVGPSYVVGPGDSLSIDLWGGVSQRIFRTVDREGRVVLPEAGPLLVSGRTLGDVQEAVQRVLRTQFRDVSADVSLLRLRTVRVYVVGDVASPGAYDVSSLSTPLNALFAAGGVTPQGSLRRLQHYRGKQLIEQVDVYDLLLHGIRGDLERLENGDSLLVPPLGPVVTLEGMVRRPALYELHAEKTLEDALDLAGGILPAAALRHIEVQRLVAHEKRTMLSVEIGEKSDAEAIRAQLRGFVVQDGDEIHIFPLAPYNSAAVYLEGHVLRPGRYSYKPGMKLSDLVSSYSDFLPEPSGRYAEIIRLSGPDYHPVVESFDLAAALAHPETAPTLEPLDTLRIFGRYDFEPAPEVLVTGEVRAPGRYRASGQQHLRDAIYQAGGVSPEAWLDTAQLFRAQPDGTTKVFSISLRDALAGDPLNNILVQPRDHILIHRQPERVDPPRVYVSGDVAHPGRYPLAANMRVSDLVRSSGGLLRSANSESGDLTHYTPAGKASGGPGPQAHRPIDLAAALAGNTDHDLPLRDGDVLTVPQQAGWKDIGASVSIRGEVGKPGVYGVRAGERLSSLLRRAGGLLPTAYPQAAVFERNQVRELQQKSRDELIQRIEQESAVVKTAVNASAGEEAVLQQAAVQQRQRALDALRRAPVSGRLVMHLRPGEKGFEGSPDDLELRAGDSFEIPKKPGVVLIIGQVYNSNAISYTPGKNAGWYLSRAGGPTSLANKKAIFVLRVNGSVTSSSGGMWSGGVLSAGIGPGDTIVVPERPVLGGNGWKNFSVFAQMAQAGALAAAVALK